MDKISLFVFIVLIVFTLSVFIFIIHLIRKEKKKRQAEKNDKKPTEQVGSIYEPGPPARSRTALCRVYEIIKAAKSEDIFKSINEPLDQICFTQKWLYENREHLISLLDSNSFISLFKKGNEYFVYYGTEEGINILRLKDVWVFYPHQKIAVIIHC